MDHMDPVVAPNALKLCQLGGMEPSDTGSARNQEPVDALRPFDATSPELRPLGLWREGEAQLGQLRRFDR